MSEPDPISTPAVDWDGEFAKLGPQPVVAETVSDFGDDHLPVMRFAWYGSGSTPTGPDDGLTSLACSASVDFYQWPPNTLAIGLLATIARYLGSPGPSS